MGKGKIIIMEGAGDGIGKSTQLALLKDRLLAEKKELVFHHFPSYGTYQGKPVEMYLSGAYGTNPERLSPYFINTLYAMDRAITWHTELEQRYENGETMLFDRYTTSSLIYQSSFITDPDEKKRFLDYVCDFEYHKLGIAEPDLVIFLDAPFELLVNNMQARDRSEGVEPDIHESDLAFLRKAYESAHFVAEYLKWKSVDTSISKEQMRSKEDIHEDVYSLAKQLKL